MPVPGVNSTVVNIPAVITSLLYAVCWAVRLMPIRFRRMGHGGMVSTLGTAMGCEYVSLRFRSPRFAACLHLMKQFAHGLHLTCCHFTETGSDASSIHNHIFCKRFYSWPIFQRIENTQFVKYMYPIDYNSHALPYFTNKCYRVLIVWSNIFCNSLYFELYFSAKTSCQTSVQVYYSW